MSRAGVLLKACKDQSSISSRGHAGASPVTTTPPQHTHTHFQGINIWARICSSGPLMADHSGAWGNTIHADEQPARREMEGVVSIEGSQERRQIQIKQKFLMEWLKMKQRDRGEAEGLIGLFPP